MLIDGEVECLECEFHKQSFGQARSLITMAYEPTYRGPYFEMKLLLLDVEGVTFVHEQGLPNFHIHRNREIFIRTFMRFTEAWGVRDDEPYADIAERLVGAVALAKVRRRMPFNELPYSYSIFEWVV